MSKYNEEVRLQNIKEFVDEYANEEELTSVDGVRATIDIIEEQLNNYKKLLNANPSEALGCLDSMYARLPQWDLCRNLDQYNIIKQVLIQAEQDKKKARCWDILVSNRLIWIEDGELKLGREFDCELRFDETDFENKEEFSNLKEGLK